MDSKYAEKDFSRILGIGFPDLSMNLLLCNVFSKNIKYIFILKCPEKMLEYHFSKVFGILECNFINLASLLNEVKQTIHAEETHNSDYVMTCINTIFST